MIIIMCMCIEFEPTEPNQSKLNWTGIVIAATFKLNYVCVFYMVYHLSDKNDVSAGFMSFKQ